jgi:serine/threonine-protein kinase
MSDLIGKIVCGYRIIARIGEGGMGQVWLAESAFLREYKQKVAIKTLTSRNHSQKHIQIMRDLFEREANIHVQLRHPQIVSVIQFAVEGDDSYLLLEYVPGYEHKGKHIGSISDVIRHETGPIPHDRALKLFIQALDAISFAHHFRYRWEGQERVGLVHRDIKPANLLLADARTVKVTDFGIVKVRHNEGVSSATSSFTPGTSSYMSPEAILGPDHFGLAELDARSDIYALGVTLFEMLTGRIPFQGEPGKNAEMMIRAKHISELPPAPSSIYPAIPRKLDTIVIRALEKRPENRWQSAREFKQAILDFLGEAEPTTNISSVSSGIPGATASVNTAGIPGSTGEMEPFVTRPIDSGLSQSVSPTALATRKRNNFRLLLLTLAFALSVLALIWHWQPKNTDRQAQQIPVTPSPSPVPTSPQMPQGMLLIRGGTYQMGRDLTDAEKKIRVADNAGNQAEVFSFDYPAHPVTVADFFLDMTEISNREYARFVRETQHAAPSGWKNNQPPEGAEDNPVTSVSYNDAVEFCVWRTAQRKDRFTYRLPAEEEWELAARGAGAVNGQVNLYPWGSAWQIGMANTAEARLRHPQIVTANRAGASGFGILNLCGNVAEWTATDFNHYPGSDRPTPREPGYQGTYQVVRGGSFDYPKEWAMTTTRAWARPTVKAPNIGFRCAADASQAMTSK